jgi:hypothetical protein
MTKHGKQKLRNKMLFGDFVAAAYAGWGEQMGPKIVQRAVNERQIGFFGGQRLVILEKQARVTVGGFTA